MTLFDFEELTQYWIENPPLHLMIGSYLGGGMTKRSGARHFGRAGRMGGESGRKFEHLLAELGPAFAAGDVHAGLGPAILDFAELRRDAQTEERLGSLAHEHSANTVALSAKAP